MMYHTHALIISACVSCAYISELYLQNINAPNSFSETVLESTTCGSNSLEYMYVTIQICN